MGSNRTNNRGDLKRRLRQRAKQQRGMQKETAAAQAQAAQASLLLCALLAQCGGSKTLTQGTLDQCIAAHDRMGFKMAPGKVAGEFELTLLYRDGPEQADGVAPIHADHVPVGAPALAIKPLVITG